MEVWVYFGGEVGESFRVKVMIIFCKQFELNNLFVKEKNTNFAQNIDIMIGSTLVKQRTANTAGYDRVVEMVKSVPTECLDDISRYIGYVLYCYNERETKIRNLKKAIQEGYESGICEDFDADSFLQQLKSERKNG